MSDENISEKEANYISGWLALALLLMALAGVVWLFLGSVLHRGEPPVSAIIGLLIIGFLTKGFVILPPNIAGVLVFFGRYSGTLREGGFFWYNPFSKRQNISLRVVNLNTPTLKVNDMAGNPIEVAAVIAWRVTPLKWLPLSPGGLTIRPRRASRLRITPVFWRFKANPPFAP